MGDDGKLELRRANDNPWYCLATIHGEQPADRVDYELADKNRVAWNRWIAAVLSDEQRAELVKNGFAEAELVPLRPEERSALVSALAVRAGRESELPPEPTERPDFSFTHFDRTVYFEQFLFNQEAFFRIAAR
jgi:hypothetical protein